VEVDPLNARQEELLGERMATLGASSLLSIIMPVYNPPPTVLDRAIQSVAEQIYENWELCIADDASTDPAIRRVLEEWSGRDRRIKGTFREGEGNISAASNTAAGMATGEYVVLLDHDDEITRDGLAEAALYLSEREQTDILYSDEDQVDSYGRRMNPHFKPDWSPELLLSYMYPCH